jgi:pyruvate kinase
VSDVANAVFDGTDAVMLSAETAIGHDPVEVVRTMARIARRAEQASNYEEWAVRLSSRLRSDTDHAVTAAMTHAAWQAALDAGCCAVLCCTRSGFTARSMARFRPRQRLLGLSPEPRTCNQLTLTWGVEPMAVERSASVDEVVWFAVERAAQAGIAAPGDRVAVLAGAPDSPSASTDVLRIVEVR